MIICHIGRYLAEIYQQLKPNLKTIDKILRNVTSYIYITDTMWIDDYEDSEIEISPNLPVS